MRTPTEVVSAFIAEWQNPHPDPAQLAAYFTEDAVYHNIPASPVVGPEAIAAVFQSFLAQVSPRGWEVLRQIANGNLVMNERIDRFAIGDRLIELPVAGAFEVRGERICAWRDYFDMNTWLKALARS
ncbi:limonene-1,2-epoxide hydrolase family protein [Tepidiforma sp.]|uniref:limonene-1,2-epoxide hydrolase family protein n=1 Tax=Tepidiforma sp. TaxID=2682230 RepID=UPI002ADD4906|nr:limonene-1,2-epoxide hydrolase family protein [Tepidiforma sp.]